MKKVAIILSVVALYAVPLAAEDINHFICRSANMAIVEQSEELTLFTWDDNGVIVGQVTNDAFHAMNSRCNGIVKMQKGINPSTANGYCKYLDKDGDVVYLEWSHGPTIQRSWRFIAGTGKWKGITGGGDYNTRESGVRTKAQVKDTFQNCVHVTGTYKLPGS